MRAEHTMFFFENSLGRVTLAWARQRVAQRQGPFVWASCSSRTWTSLKHSRLGEMISLRWDWQYSPLFHACSRNAHTREHTRRKQDKSHTTKNLIHHSKSIQQPKNNRRNILNGKKTNTSFPYLCFEYQKQTNPN